MFKRNKKKKQTDAGYSFITDFNLKSREIESNVKKYWTILLKDEILNKILPKYYKLIYRIVKNILDPPPQWVKIFPDLKGFFRCNQCATCSWRRRRSEFDSVTKKKDMT